jgi:hypothetical protein
MLDRNIEIAEFEDILIQLDQQLIEELKNFKQFREKEILTIIKRFFTERQNYELEIATVFEIDEENSLKIPMNLEYDQMSMKSNENHFG